jgi:hypothetical protein
MRTAILRASAAIAGIATLSPTHGAVPQTPDGLPPPLRLTAFAVNTSTVQRPGDTAVVDIRGRSSRCCPSMMRASRCD